MRFKKTQQKSYEVDVDKTISEYADMVYRIAVVQMKNKSDAEDVFQEVFLRLVKYRHTIESDEHLKAWLIRVTLNCSKKEFSKAVRQHEVSDQSENRIIEHGAYDTYPILDSGGEVLEAVKNLPVHYRSVIHLFYYEEYSIKEISSLLTLSVSTVKTRLSRAREMLRSTIDRP